MGNTEDYLDGLLNSVEGKKNRDTELEEAVREALPEQKPLFETNGRNAEQDFLDSFEQEFLSGENTDEFIRQFERELEEDGKDMQEKPAGANAQPMSTPSSMEEDEMDFMVDTLGELPVEDSEISMENSDVEEPLPKPADAAMEDEGEIGGLSGNDAGLMDLLQSEGDFSGIGDLADTEETQTEKLDELSAGMDGFTLEEVPIDDTMVLEDAAEPETEEKADKDKKEVSGFLKKLSRTLFGEEEEEAKAKTLEPEKASSSATPSIEELSDENLMLLQELEGIGGAEPEEPQEVPETEEEAKARKKREKEEKKAKKKAEKAEKKAQAKAEKEAKAAKKPKKEKKPKKPKEPDRTPPLPKKPVILCFVMAASFLALVLLGTNLFGYSASMANAEKEFGLGNYEEAYRMVAGLEIKEQDVAVYQKYRVMGMVAGEYRSYQTFMEAGIYDMALDSLIRATGRCQKYQPEAEANGCAGELSRVHEQTLGALGGFGIDEVRALELYALEEREDYSVQIQEILEQAGYLND